MRSLPRIVFVALVMAIASAATRAPDPANGERLAKRWCASCHVVSQTQRDAPGEAPPFATMAKKPNFDVNQLAFFLLNPHPVMPNMGLSRFEAADLAAYIAQQGK